MYYTIPGFLALYDLAPPNLPPVIKLSVILGFPVLLCIAGRAYGRESEGSRRGKELNHTTTRKSGPLSYIKHSLISSIFTYIRLFSCSLIS
jgi:hypothetical protein